MQRDWLLINDILVKLEESDWLVAGLTAKHFATLPREKVAYHLRLVVEAGLATGNEALCIADSLTAEGHEFLDLTRNPLVWNRIAQRHEERHLDLSFATVKHEALRVAIEVLQ